ncbi:DHA2 family efflux MFS transporter permease subunit [Terrilactibacillus laevilacticus]|uniref:DHA2 family efflux MFS transporter permease subunit n=1 Tax=Terrilactibacillus laevilacticus TaxID=1380157 RepID=A0ABW5PUZ2_9BACI|nr:DHA2 family efflux MFS transporter permease subunit [Terrilactibacillus laevilacticus]
MDKHQTIGFKAYNRRTIFGIMMAGAVVAFLNQTLINVALPQMMNSLHITADVANWLTTIFMLVNGIVIPITAFLMARFSTRQLYLSSIGLFTLGTLICGIAPSFSVILLGRVIQAIGAGILFPLITNVIFTLYPSNRRGFAMGIFGVAMNFAPAIGPTLSGWVVEHHSWRVLFFIIFPFALLNFILSIKMVKNVSEVRRSKLDVLGVILSTIGFGGILYGFAEAGSMGWTNRLVLTMFVIGVLSLTLFVWRQLAVKNPILEFRIFRYKIFTLTTIINVTITMAMFSGMILMPIYMQNARGFSPVYSGLMLLPGGIVMGIMSPITGKLFDRFGAKWLAVSGLAMTIVTTYLLTKLTLDTTFTYVVLVYTARMLGMSLIMMPIFTAGLNELSLELNRFGTAMVNALRMVAGAVGMAFFVSIMTKSAASHVKQIILDNQINPTDKIHMAIVTRQATVIGINEAFLIATGLTIVAFFLAFFINRTSPETNEEVNKEEVNEEILLEKRG